MYLYLLDYIISTADITLAGYYVFPWHTNVGFRQWNTRWNAEGISHMYTMQVIFW